MNIGYHHHMIGLNSIQTAYIATRLIFFYEATGYLDWLRNFMEMSPFKPYLSPLSTCCLLTWHYVTSSVKISQNYLGMNEWTNEWMNVSINKWVSEWVCSVSLKISTLKSSVLTYTQVSWVIIVVLLEICHFACPWVFYLSGGRKWSSNFSWNYVCLFTVLLLHYVQYDMLW
jgi:hypothetical protein